MYVREGFLNDPHVGRYRVRQPQTLAHCRHHSWPERWYKQSLPQRQATREHLQRFAVHLLQRKDVAAGSTPC